MGKGIPLGRIAGVRVGMDVSVFLTATLYTVILATSSTLGFPGVAPGRSDTAYWIAGVAGALFLFLSLLVHETGHALVARDEGIGVLGMELTLLGGVTRMESSPTDPGAELRVSVIGPIASAACGVVFLVGAVLIPDHGTWDLVGAVFAWAGGANLLLAALNMVPAAPLDGGKVLSSIIWRSTGSQATAMTWTAGAGVVGGMAATAWGLREVLSPQTSRFAVAALILGGFVAFNAFVQLRAAPLYRVLDGLGVRDAMVAGAPTAPSWATVGEFLRSTPLDAAHQAYPVVEADGRVTGLLTASAIRAVPPHTWDQLQVASLAFPLERLTLVTEGEQLLGALQKLEGGDVRTGLVVATDGRIVGTLDQGVLDQLVARSKAGLETTSP
ncbi:MAG: hypothetical protein KDA97_04075 [Acidimicrobiales bacterium]|nr:hypothetical protein [Acidimicrobiales bacterium]